MEAKASEKIIDKAIELVIESPLYILCMCLAYTSGHAWSYTILVYCTDNKENMLTNLFAKIVLGVLWFSPFMLISYLLRFKNVEIMQDSFNSVLFFSVLLAIAIQAIFIAILMFIKRKK